MRPELHTLEQRIARSGGDDQVFDRIRDGEQIAAIMKSFGYSRGMFYNWLKAGGSDRRSAWETARKDSAHAYVDKAQDAIEDKTLDVAPTAADVNRANSKAKFYQWLAGKLNRADYGDDVQIAVAAQLNVGELHLNALLTHGLARPQQQIEEAEVVDAEIIEHEEVLRIAAAEEEFEPNYERSES